MYQNIYCYRNKGSINVHLWDDERGYSNFTVKNYAYIRSNTGVYRSLYNDKLKMCLGSDAEAINRKIKYLKADFCDPSYKG